MNNIDLENIEVIKADTILKTIASSYEGFKQTLKLLETGEADFDGLKLKAEKGIKFEDPIIASMLVFIAGITQENTNKGWFALTDEQMKELEEAYQILKIKISLEKFAELGIVKEINKKDNYGFNSYIVLKDNYDLVNELLKKEEE